MVPILDGLKPGERVVVRGALLLDRQAEQLL
jgi:multidrug efflux pump subunit AcrA (membrane-fusion protein)